MMLHTIGRRVHQGVSTPHGQFSKTCTQTLIHSRIKPETRTKCELTLTTLSNLPSGFILHSGVPAYFSPRMAKVRNKHPDSYRGYQTECYIFLAITALSHTETL